MSSRLYWWVYRNYFPAKWCFYTGDDTKGLYNEQGAKEWYEQVKKYMTEIEIVRPPRQIVKMSIPIREWWEDEDAKEDKSFVRWVTNTKIEPRMGYVIDQILNEYYYGKDWCFHLREDVKKEEPDADVVFTMREIIEGMFRINPIKVRTYTDKETQQINFVDWNIGSDAYDVPFTYMGKEYKTNIFWLYGAKFRDAIYPNSDFNGSRLQSWQKDYSLKRGKITVVIAPRGSWKSLGNTEFISEYLFKEINLPHEFDRPFLIVYGGMSRDANMQVVNYIRAMARTITTNKNVLNWKNTEQTLTLYDGHNERVIKFVSQGQEWQGFTGLRPHLVVLDEAYRLERRMYDVAIGTVEAPIVMISTVDYTTKQNWCHDLYRTAVARQREYVPVEELIKETWIKFWMHKVKTREQLMKKVNRWEIWEMRDYFYSQRPLVWLKYTIYDVDRYSDIQKEELIDRAMQAGEDVCLAEYFSEIADVRTVFNSDGLIEWNIPSTFDKIACGFDEAEEQDNPGFVAVGYKWHTAYVIHSEILDKTDFTKKYARIKQLLAEMQAKSPSVLFASDLTRVQWVWLRELTDFVREPDFPILWTSAKNGEIKRKRPYYVVPKERMITIVQDEFFKKGNIIFSDILDIEWGLIEEIGNYKRTNRWGAKGTGLKSDDQVSAMIMALFALYRWHVKNISPIVTAGLDRAEERYDAFLTSQQGNIDMEEYERQTAKIVSNFW